MSHLHQEWNAVSISIYVGGGLSQKKKIGEYCEDCCEKIVARIKEGVQ